MITGIQTADRVMLTVLKEPFSFHTVTSLAKALNKSRQGIWKTLHLLEENKLLNLEPVNITKTSTITVKLNWSNPVTEKTLSLLLTKESLKQQRWIVNFAEFKNNVDFLLLFGSILSSQKEAQDIDIIAVVPKNNFKIMEEIQLKVQQTQLKKIHLIDITSTEFDHELKKPNHAYRDALKKGIILYGQDNFIEFMRNLQK